MTGTRTTTVEQAALARARALYGPIVTVARLTGTPGTPGYFQTYASVPTGGTVAIGPSYLVA